MYRYIIKVRPERSTARDIVEKYRHCFDDHNCFIGEIDSHRIMVKVPERLVVRTVYDKSRSYHNLPGVIERHIVLDNGPPCSLAVQKILLDPDVFDYLETYVDPDMRRQILPPRFHPEIAKPTLIRDNCSKIACHQFKKVNCPNGKPVLINGTGCCPFYMCPYEYSPYTIPIIKEGFGNVKNHSGLLFLILVLILFYYLKKNRNY